MTDIFLRIFEVSVSVSPLIILLILPAPFLNRRYAVKWKYWIWIFLAARLLVPLNVGDAAGMLPQRDTRSVLQSEQTPASPLTDTAAPPARIMVEIPAQMTAPLWGQTEKDSASLLDIVVFVWMAGAFAFISVHAISYLYYKNQAVKRARAVKDRDTLRQLSRLKRELGVRGRIRVMEYPEAASPMIIGFLHPVLILPKEQYSEEELFFILKHELIHLKHGDVYAKFLFTAANAVHWFNPFVWLMRREAAVDMELSCDERVVQGADYDVRRAYTETLLSTLHKRCVGKCLLPTQFYGGKQIMRKRFRNILIRKGKKNGTVILVYAVMITVCAGALTGCSLPEDRGGAEDGEISAEREDGEDAAESPGETGTERGRTAEGSEAASGTDSPSAEEVPQDGLIYGYISGYENGSVTVDWQKWVTPESEDWKPEYDEDAGFEVVDAEGGDITYRLLESCAYSVLENHHDPVVELDESEFADYLTQMEYPVLWIIELENGQVKSIAEQYRP